MGLGLLPLPLFFEGLHTFSHVCFCSAALWFRFSESLASLGGLLVCLLGCHAAQASYQNDFCLSPAKPETALVHRTHSGNGEGRAKDQRTTTCASEIPRPHSAQLRAVRAALPEASPDHFITYPVLTFPSPNMSRLSDCPQSAREPVSGPFAFTV